MDQNRTQEFVGETDTFLGTKGKKKIRDKWPSVDYNAGLKIKEAKDVQCKYYAPN